jgi:DNA primase catalytic core
MNPITILKVQNDFNVFTFVKENVKIEEAAKRLGLKLEKTGKSYQGECPTGHASTGGKCFSIESENQYFRCFNCETSGDVITLVEITKKISPIEAAEWLIKEFNLEDRLQKQSFRFRKLTPEQKSKLDLQKIIAKLYQSAFEWMKPQLFTERGKSELQYLTQIRKYDYEDVQKSDWCYFPETSKIKQHLLEVYPEQAEMIQNLSLHGFTGERLHLAIPYRNSEGLITGFLKRAPQKEGITFADNKGKERTEVRWDSTEGMQKTDLFNLFNCKGQEDLLIVEGYPEAVILPAMGMNNIAAIGQGCLSQSHLVAMEKYKVKNVTISFDNDNSGPGNTEEAVMLLLKESAITPYVLEPSLLKTHKDPDEYVSEFGLENFTKLLKGIELGGLWLCKRKTKDLSSLDPIEKQRVLEECVEIAQLTNNPIHESQIIKYLMGAFDLKEKEITKLLKQKKDDSFVSSYKNIKYKENDRYFPFIEQGTAAYAYYDRVKDTVHLGVGKDILTSTLASAQQKLPDPLSVLSATFDVHNDNRIDLEKEIFNFFVPSEYMLYAKTTEIINPRNDFHSIYKLLSNLIPNYQERKLFINWLAGIMQTREKQLTAWVFKGEQGAGKGLFLTHILKKLLGRKQAIQVEDAQLKNEFNPWLQNSLLIAFNEVARDNSSRNMINSKLKAIITDEEIQINEKNVKAFYLTNYVNCLFFSNESVPIFIEQGDRRFNVVMTGRNLNKQDWFENDPIGFIASMEKEIPAFAQFLMNWEYDPLKAKRVFTNAAKETMVSSAMNRFEEFAHKLKTQDIDWFKDQVNGSSPFNIYKLEPDVIAKKVLKVDLRELFLSIYDDTKINDINFGKKMKEYGVDSYRVAVPGNSNKKLGYYTWK